MSTLKKFYRRHHDLGNPYNVELLKLISDLMATAEI